MAAIKATVEMKNKIQCLVLEFLLTSIEKILAKIG
jgi:hypothetical protein